MNTGILKAEGLCKSYGTHQVLHNLDLELLPGKIYGLIGRNGAGKTTLLGILTAQNTKDSGSVTYDGEPVWENQRALDHISLPLPPDFLLYVAVVLAAVMLIWSVWSLLHAVVKH